MPAAVIEWGKLAEVVWVSALAGVGVTALFAIVVYGGSRAAEARRTGSGSTTVFSAVALLAFLGFAAVVVFGLSVILNKS